MMLKKTIKIVLLIMLALSLFGCKEKKTYSLSDSAYKIESHKVDMSGYAGVSSVNHQFVQVEMSEVFKTMENGGTGIFVLSATWCPHCQKLLKEINDVASERDLTVYYVSGDREGNYPITDEDIDQYKVVFDEYLEVEDGRKVVLMPHVLCIGNGEVIYSKISGDDERNITNEYRKAFAMFEK